MADDKTVSLRIDGSQGEQALEGIDRAAEGAASSMGDLGEAITKTETNTKRLVGTSRDYNSAARSVGDSVQAITRFEAAYRASLTDTGNSAQVRAQILASAFSRNIGGAADEKRAIELLGRGHKDAAEAVRFMVTHLGPVPGVLKGVSSSAGNLGAVLQQAGYQVADIANQVGNGTSVFIAMGQQMGQLLGVFGTAGAIMGAVVSVAGPMAAKLLDTSSAIKAAEDAQKAFNAALREGEDLLKSDIQLQGERAERVREAALVARTSQYELLQQELADLEKKRKANVVPTGIVVEGAALDVAGDVDAALTAQEDARLVEIVNGKKSQLAELEEQINALINQNPQATSVSREVLSSGDGAALLDAKMTAVQDAVDTASLNDDQAALQELTETYGALSRARATYVTEGQRAVLLAEAQAKASTMSATEGQKYLSQRTAEINAMGKVIEQGELEQQQKAATIEANTAAAKSYGDMAKAISAANIESDAKLAILDLDTEREALAQRKTLGETSAAEELAQAISISDRKRQVEENAAQQKLALLRRTAGTERTEIEAAERAITEMKKQHSLDRQKQIDEEVAARRAQAKQLALIAAEAEAASAGRKVDAKAEGLSMAQVTGDVTGAQAQADIERQLSQERYQIELDLLNKKLELASQEPVERAKVLNEIKALEEKHANDMAKIDRQVTQNRLSEISAWTAPFKSAVNSTVTGFIQGTLTMKKAAAQAAQSIAASYLNKFADISVDWFNRSVLLATRNQTLGAQEVVTQTAVEAEKVAATSAGQTSQTAVTRAGTAARTSLGRTEDAGFLARIGRQLGEWLGLEGAKTGGTVAGEAIRTEATAVGASAREGVDVAQTTSSVGQSAARGAAGTYADVSEHVPYGWLVAPALAAATFVAIKAFSSRGGEAEVTQDGALYTLHEKETVLPAAFAVPLRSALYSGALSGKAATPEHIQSAMSALMSAGPSQDRTSAAIAATGLGIPSAGRFALPDFLRNGPNFQAGNTTTNTTNRTEKRVHVSNTFNISALDGASVKRVLMDNKGAVSEAMLKALANSDPNAMAFKSKK